MIAVPIYSKTVEGVKVLKGSGVLLQIDDEFVVTTCKHLFGENRQDGYYTVIEENELRIGPGTVGYFDDPNIAEYNRVIYPPEPTMQALIIDDIASHLSKTFNSLR